jgi:hypothetical protein
VATHYINTDLDLISAQPLDALLVALESAGLWCLWNDDAGYGQRWEVNGLLDFKEPAPTLDVLLSAIETLPEEARIAWDACTERTFDIGYTCGAEPWAFQQEIPTELLVRIVAQKISLRLTLYPERSS